MPTSYTSLLGLALPVTGELSGTWGDEVNNYITQYIDASVAGTQTISGSQTAVTLSKTTNASLSQAGSGATGSSQYMIINCTGNPASMLTITAPAASKPYIVINGTSTSQDVKIVGVGPTTGVTLVSGEKAVVAWNGSDFVKVASTVVPASSITGVLGAANGGTGLSSPGSNGNVLTSNGTAWTSAALPAGGLTYVYKTANYNVSNKEGVLADTSGGPFTVTLPATPSVGDQVVVADAGASWGTNNLTVGRNGSTIGGLAQDLVCDITGVSVQLVYDGTTWEVYAQVGGNTGLVQVSSGGTGATTLTANNVILGNGTSAVQFVAPGSSGNVLTSNGTTWTSSAPPGANLQEFTSSGTWTKPSGATFVMVEAWGAGGGGGSGRRGAAATTRTGGSGGGGGAYAYRLFKASDLGATVTVTIGAGGSGGAARTINDNEGLVGTDGGNTTFGSSLTAFGGAGGTGGSSVAIAAGAGGGVLSAGVQGVNNGGLPLSVNGATALGGFGGDHGSANTGQGAGFGGGSGGGSATSGTYDGTSSYQGGAGGGAGGGITSADAIFAASAGGTLTGRRGGGGAAGGTGANGTAGTGRNGGGGGGAATASAAGAGAAGGYAAGGGGGGASLNGFNSGAGGTGGNGLVRVYSW